MGRTACTEPQCLYKGALYLFLPYYVRNSNMLQPVLVQFKHVGVTHSVNKSGGLIIYDYICRRLLDIGLTLFSVEMWFENVDGQEGKEKSHKVQYCLNILWSQISIRIGGEK